MNKDIIFAGASVIYGLHVIKKYLENKGFSILFIENNSSFHSIQKDERTLVVCTEKIPYIPNSILIPLNEYWVTQYKNSDFYNNIPEKAYKASRSKSFFNSLMEEAGIDFCHSYNLSDIKHIVCNGLKCIIKPDSLYGGYGVKIISPKNIHTLDIILSESNVINSKLQSVLDIKKTRVNCFEYLDGQEYSTDVFINKGKIQIVRLCKKIITNINDTPCLLGYHLVVPSLRFKNLIQKWISVIYDEHSICFSQFDFIETTSGRIIPIDFACRVGGGLKDLLVYTKKNVYLDAIRRTIEQHYQQNLVKDFFQLNIIPAKVGRIMNSEFCINFPNLKKLKKTGDYVDRIGSSTHNRLGIILGKCVHYNLLVERSKKLVINSNIFDYQTLAIMINDAWKIIYGNDKVEELTSQLYNIKSYDDIVSISKNESHILYPWIPAIIFEAFGLKIYKTCSLNQKLSKTIIMIHPTIENPDIIIDYIKLNLDISYTVEMHQFLFTDILSAKLYGGYPWFLPYHRLCTEIGCYEKKSIYLTIETTNNIDLYEKIEKIKTRFRDENPQFQIKKAYPEYELNGVINPFHSPNPLENHLHMKALSESKIS